MAVVFWAALIFYMSAQPSLQTSFGIWDFILRKIAHFVEFAVLCLLLWNALRRYTASPSRAAAIAAPVALLYAFSDEFHQLFVQGRTGALRDVAIDASGIAVMALMIIWLRPKKRLRVEEPAG